MAAQRNQRLLTVAYLGFLVIGIMAGIFHLVQGRFGNAAIAAVAVLLGMSVQMVEWRRAAAPLRQAIEVFSTVAAPPMPLLVRATGTRGDCPLGFRPGDVWSIDPSGHVEPGLCRPALLAIGPILGALPGSLNQQAACHCPHGGQEVDFAVTKGRAA